MCYIKRYILIKQCIMNHYYIMISYYSMIIVVYPIITVSLGCVTLNCHKLCLPHHKMLCVSLIFFHGYGSKPVTYPKITSYPLVN